MRAAAVAAVLLLAPAPLPTYGAPQLLGRVPLPEVSGVAAAGTGSTVFVEQDSGNGPHLQRLGRDGRLLTTYDLPVPDHDWEDLAGAPDAQGRASLFLADIGDNDAQRSRVEVHRFAEPAPGSRTVGPVTTYRFRYEDGPHDAEALLVLPGARSVAVVTKTLGPAGVYEAPLTAGAVQVLHRVAQLDLGPTGTPGGPAGAFGQVLVTGGAVAPDGSRLALRTYTDLYEWPLGSDLAQVLARPGTRTPLPPTRQGEAVAYERDGTAVLVTSEGRGAPLQRLARQAPPDPATPAPSFTPSPAPVTAPTPVTAAPDGSAPTPVTAAPDGSAPTSVTTASAPRPGRSTGPRLLLGLGLVAVLTLVLAASRARRRTGR